LPTHIFFYRDGVGEGQLRFVHEHEVQKLRQAISNISPDIKFSFIVVTKKHHTQFYKPKNGNGFENPESGTVVDTVVTDPNAFDFYLISQCVRKGTVSPAMYNVIEDGARLSGEKYQLLTYKLTHMYYNWSGPIRVPAICQYAHKLAFLVGQSLHREAHTGLSERLFFL
jgi:aubergine-like protein